MDFDFSDEQRLLKDSVERLLGNRYTFEQRRAHAAEPEGWSRALWKHYAELGLLGLPFAEDQGGLGGGPVETMIVMEAFGRALVLEPYLATVVLAGGLLRHGVTDSLASMLPARIADGSLILAFGHTERHARFNLADVSTTARREAGFWVLEGEKTIVLSGDCADQIIVTARVAGGQRDRRGIGLFLVDMQAPGVSRRAYPTARRAARRRPDPVPASASGPDALIGPEEDALPVVERVVDEAIAALAAEAVGAMAAMHETTIDYLKTRKQFGSEIGRFQVLQHRAVDMLVALEQARSMALFATMMAGEDDATERSKAMAAAKVQIGRSGRLVGQQAIQLHGGMGMTMEYKVGHYFKRVTMIDTLFGTADHHLARAGGGRRAAVAGAVDLFGFQRG
jgi:pimeloyl-CoA dehydrogenase small subunit